MDKVATDCTTSAGKLRKRFIPHQLSGILEKVRVRLLGNPSDESELSIEKRMILKELDETLRTLHIARINYDLADTPEIVEACIYEIKSAESRYSYLLRKVKQLGIRR